MRKVKLTVLSLLALTTMSLASCTGAQGEKGDKGDQGEQGIQGEPGEPGEPGEDGSFWYSGEGVPSSDLGKEGDMYLDTTNSDVYQKGAEGWTKIANIKGEDGEDGEDGKNGSNGANGKTAWSNTILPSENGYVTANVGSAVVGEDVTFTVHPDSSSYVLEKLTIWNNGKEVSLPKGEVVDGVVSYTLAMQENGFVVLAEFGDYQTVGSSSYIDGGYIYTQGQTDGMGNIIDSGTRGDQLFEDGDGLSEETALLVNGNQLSNISSGAVEATNATYFKLAEDITTEGKIPIISTTSESGERTNIDLNGKTLTINNSSLTADASALKITDEDVTLSNGTIEYSYSKDGTMGAISLTQETGTENADGNLTLEGVVLNTDASGVGVHQGRGNILIKDSIINAKVFGLSTNAGGDNKKVNIVIDNSKLITTEKGGFSGTDNDSTGLIVNIPEANVTVKNNSVITGLRQAVIVRGGTATIENSTIEWANSYNGSSGNRYNFGYSSGNEVANSAIVIGDDDSNNANYGFKAELTLTGVTYKYTNSDAAGTQSLNEVLPLEETSTEPDYYEIFVGCASSKEAILNIDISTYNQFDKDKIIEKGDGTTKINIIGYEEKNNVFVDGQLYSKGLVDQNGNVSVNENDKVLGVKFADGDGTEEDPLQISNVDQFETLLGNEDVRLGGYSFLITDDIDFNDAKGEYFFPHFSGKISGEVDTEGKPKHKVTLVDRVLTSGYLFGDTWGDVAIENLNVETTNVGLIAYSGWKNGNKTDEMVNYKLTMENLILTGEVNENLNRESNNFGVVIGQSCAYTTTIKNVINNVDYKFNSASYNGAIFGGYFRTYNDVSANKKAQVTIENCEYGGTLTAGYAGFLFGNSANFNTTYADYNFSGNKLTGKLNGTIKSDILFGIGENTDYTLEDGAVTYRKEDLSESLAKNITADNRTLTLTGELENKELKYDLTYIHYSVGYKNGVKSGTQMLTHYVDKAVVSNNSITVPEKYFVYSDFGNTDEKYVKFTKEELKLEELGWELYLNDIDDNKSTYEPTKSEKCIITIYEGETVAGVYVLE